MSKINWRVLTAIEAVGLTGYVGWYIWQLQKEKPLSWTVFPIWLAASFLLHRDTLKTLGWRLDNLWPATRQGLLIYAGLVFATCMVGLWSGAYHRLPLQVAEPWRFFHYFGFCVVQQIALNSYLTNRLLYAMESPRLVALLAGTIFAALHWPNPVLVPLTLIGGVIMSWLFSRARNIIPLVIGQAILGTLVWWVLPAAWHHGMRVGPGFYSWHP